LAFVFAFGLASSICSAAHAQWVNPEADSRVSSILNYLENGDSASASNLIQSVEAPFEELPLESSKEETISLLLECELAERIVNPHMVSQTFKLERTEWECPSGGYRVMFRIPIAPNEQSGISISVLDPELLQSMEDGWRPTISAPSVPVLPRSKEQ
jgi:hypothetical protein